MHPFCVSFPLQKRCTYTTIFGGHTCTLADTDIASVVVQIHPNFRCIYPPLATPITLVRVQRHPYCGYIYAPFSTRTPPQWVHPVSRGIYDTSLHAMLGWLYRHSPTVGSYIHLPYTPHSRERASAPEFQSYMHLFLHPALQ